MSLFTFVIDFKLDPTTLFNGKNTQETMDVPHYQKILDFINLCTWAAEMSNPEPKKPFIPNNKKTGAKLFTTYPTNQMSCL